MSWVSWLDWIPPHRPRKPRIGKGDSITMIKFPVTVAAGVSPDVATTRLTFTVDGAAPVVLENPGNGASFDVVVPDGSNGSLFANYIDKAGNVSANSPDASWTNASDTTPPVAPAGAPVMGAGESV